MCSGTSEDCRLSNVSFRYCRCSCCGCLNRWQRGHDATDAREKLEHGLPKQWGCLMHCYCCFWRVRKVLKCIKTINSVMTTGEGLWCVGSRLQFAKPTQIQWVLPICGGRTILSCSLFFGSVSGCVGLAPCREHCAAGQSQRQSVRRPCRFQVMMVRNEEST